MKNNRIIFVLSYLLSFLCSGALFSDIFRLSEFNPYKIQIIIVAVILSAIIAFPLSFGGWFLIKRKYIEVCILIGALLFTVFCMLVIEAQTRILFTTYIDLHNDLFGKYLVNIYDLDYSGFAVDVTLLIGFLVSLIFLELYKARHNEKLKFRE